MNPKLQKNLYVRTLGDEKVIYDKKNGRVHFMNSTATFILDLCDGTHSQEELVERLLERYEVSRKEAEKDVKRILKDMTDNKTLNV
jgi:PqqD family protein of HPr-rel-A system